MKNREEDQEHIALLRAFFTHSHAGLTETLRITNERGEKHKCGEAEKNVMIEMVSIQNDLSEDEVDEGREDQKEEEDQK